MTEFPARRAFGDVVVDLADVVAAFGGSALPLRARSIEVTLPIEADLEMRNSALAFIADMPRTVRRTDFDRPTSQLRLSLVAVPTEEIVA